MATGRVKENLAFLQYRNTALFEFTNTGFVNIPLGTDTDSKPNNRLTKVNATDFRADFNGVVEAYFKLFMDFDSGFFGPSDQTVVARMALNGAAIPGTQVVAWADDTDEPGGAECSRILPVSSGDIITFQIASLTGEELRVQANVFLGRVKVRRDHEL